MKLNKVLALALSGVMAVSMLAGCKGETGNGDQNTEVQPTVSNAVSVMNDAQSAVKFAADTDFDAALAAAAKKALHANVAKAGYTASAAGAVVTDSDPVYKELDKKLTVYDNLNSSNYVFNNIAAAADPGKTETKTILYVLNADGLSEKAALEQIATIMKADDDYYPETVTLSSPSGTYEATYTGRVSVVTVNTADGGDTATAYYIAVSVTQHVARNAQVNVNT